jgi:hypothetical protein
MAPVMDTDDSLQMTPLLEGGEEAIQRYSKRLEAVGIPHSVEMAEDCRPGG